MAQAKDKAVIDTVEESFHDSWAEGMNIEKEVLVKESFEASTSIENAYVIKRIGNVKNLNVLDLGCGGGEASVYLALKGARMTALDISQGMLDVTAKLGKKHGVSIKTVKGVSEKLPFPDKSFDLVYGNAILHHVDIEKSLAEVSRILKNSGRAIFIEPVAYNPVINIYRKMAEDVRTEDEHPLKLRDLKLFRKYFKHVSHKEFWFFTLSIFIYFYLIERVHPKQERYWKKVIYDEPKYRKGFKILNKLDRVFLTILPPLRALCWNTVVYVKKK